MSLSVNHWTRINGVIVKCIVQHYQLIAAQKVAIGRGVGKGGSKGAVAPLDLKAMYIAFLLCSTPRYSC